MNKDLIFDILTNLTVEEIENKKHVNTLFEEVIESNELWKYLILRDFKIDINNAEESIFNEFKDLIEIEEIFVKIKILNYYIDKNNNIDNNEDNDIFGEIIYSTEIFVLENILLEIINNKELFYNLVKNFSEKFLINNVIDILLNKILNENFVNHNLWDKLTENEILFIIENIKDQNIINKIKNDNLYIKLLIDKNNKKIYKNDIIVDYKNDSKNIFFINFNNSNKDLYYTFDQILKEKLFFSLLKLYNHIYDHDCENDDINTYNNNIIKTIVNLIKNDKIIFDNILNHRISDLINDSINYEIFLDIEITQNLNEDEILIISNYISKLDDGIEIFECVNLDNNEKVIKILKDNNIFDYYKNKINCCDFKHSILLQKINDEYYFEKSFYILNQLNNEITKSEFRMKFIEVFNQIPSQSFNWFEEFLRNDKLGLINLLGINLFLDKNLQEQLITLPKFNSRLLGYFYKNIDKYCDKNIDEKEIILEFLENYIIECNLLLNININL